MDWLTEIIRNDHLVAHTIILLALVSATGIMLGNIKFRGIRFGVAGVLFSGLIFGHFGARFNEEVLHFVREFGLVLFVFMMGLKVGPGFFSSLKEQGLVLNAMALAVVSLGVLATLSIIYLGGVHPSAAVGILSGATTNTPSLGAVKELLSGMTELPPEISKNPGLGYAVAYPFGVIGIVFSLILLRLFTRANVNDEIAAYEAESAQIAPSLSGVTLTVTNSNIDGLTIGQLKELIGDRASVSRISHKNKMEVATPERVIHLGDLLHVIGEDAPLKRARLIIGVEATTDLPSLPGTLISRTILVTREKTIRKSLAELGLERDYRVRITRVRRADVDLLSTPNLRLHFGDMVRVVGEEQQIEAVEKILGNSSNKLGEPQYTSIFIGIALGILLGSIPFYLPGVPKPLKFGLAGGPLIVAILFGRLGQIGPFSCYVPYPANMAVRELGIIMFLAAVGVSSGGSLVQTLLHGDGFLWMLYGVLITMLPILVVGLIARLFFKLNYLTITGVLSGAMTDPPALAFANRMARSNAQSVAYATVYPLTMLLRILSAQIIILFTLN